MKIGDQVCCKYPFLIDGYHIRDHTLILRLIESDPARAMTVITVPMYIGAIGFYPPPIDYTTPGKYLNNDHPDYYEGHPKDANCVLYKDVSYMISLDKDFTYTGKYYLKPVANGSLQVKYAKLRTENERVRILTALMHDEGFKGSELYGEILYFVLRDASKAFVRFLKDTNLDVGWSKDSPIYAFIQDPITFIEYEINVQYLKVIPKTQPRFNL